MFANEASSKLTKTQFAVCTSSVSQQMFNLQICCMQCSGCWSFWFGSVGWLDGWSTTNIHQTEGFLVTFFVL